MSDFSKLHVMFPWLIQKKIDLIQFHEQLNDGGHNQYSVKLSFTFLGFNVGDDYLLAVNHRHSGWGIDWIPYPRDSIPGWRCMSFKQEAESALERWYSHVESEKIRVAKLKACEKDRGSVVPKYKVDATSTSKPSP